MRLSAYFEKKCKALGLTVEEEIDQSGEPREKKARMANNGLHGGEGESDEDEDKEEHDVENEVEDDEDEEEEEEDNDEAEDDNDSTYGS